MLIVKQFKWNKHLVIHIMRIIVITVIIIITFINVIAITVHCGSIAIRQRN